MPTPIAKQSVMIEAPLLVVWSFVYSMTKWPEWSRQIAELSLLELPKVGARGTITTRSSPRAFQIVALEKEKSLTLLAPALWHEQSITIRTIDVGDGIVVSLEASIEGMLEPVMGRIARRRYPRFFDKVLAELKCAIEVGERRRSVIGA